MQNTLSPVGNTVGKGAETAAKPVGSVVEPLVGGVMKAGNIGGEATGAKTEGTGTLKDGEQKSSGKQTADNPLGLSS